MPQEPAFSFLSCDWGTSHFRLKQIASGSVTREFHDETGCRRLLQASPRDAEGRKQLFENHLRRALAQFEAAGTSPNQPLPLMISGMASSSIGWFELPYSTVPIPFDGTALHVQAIQWDHPPSVAATYLISGIASETNMMRGEETEAIGLLSQITRPPRELVLVLPGTHSKHLYVSDGNLREIETYMTGELFQILGQNGVLAASVDLDNEFNRTGFLAGVGVARQSLAANLFQVRTRQVLHNRPREESAWFLSGLLIGSEILDLLERRKGSDIMVGGSALLRKLYGNALECLRADRWKLFPDHVCAASVARGHEIILNRLYR